MACPSRSALQGRKKAVLNSPHLIYLFSSCIYCMYVYFYLLIYLYLSHFSSSVVFIPTVEENNSAEAEIHKSEGGKFGPKPLITEEYPFSTKAVPVLVQSQTLVSNRFFVFRHTKHQLRTRKSCS